MKNSIRRFFVLSFAITLFLSLGSFASASDLDTLVGDTIATEETTAESSEVTASDLFEEPDQSGTDALLDWAKNNKTITSESMAKAQVLAAPIVSGLNVLTSLVIILTLALIGVITAFDFAFIGVPFVRSLLYPMYNQVIDGGNQGGGGGMMSPMGGFGGMGGFGRRYGGMGMGMGMGGGGGMAPEPTSKRYQLCSDEAIACIGLMRPLTQAPPQGGGMGMGMGMGMGQQQAPEPLPFKSVVWAYFKKRVVFLIIFTFSVVFLTSSIVTGFGFKLFEFAQAQLGQFVG